MIKHLKYHQIDFEKYDSCIRESEFPTLYAASWYLDIVSKKDWEILVYGDFEMVLPIPYARAARKLFMRKIMQPYYCQQLGLFDRANTEEIVKKSMVSKFIDLQPFTYQFNHSNNALLAGKDGLKSRNNFVLALDTDYHAIEKDFSKNLVRNIRKAERAKLTLRQLDESHVPDFLKAKVHSSVVNIPQKIFNRMEQLIYASLKRDRGSLYGVFDEADFLAGAFFLKSFDRLIYLIATRTKAADSKGAAHFLLQGVIKAHIGQVSKLDFEGSEHEGVSRFFKSFGAVNEEYFCV